MGARMLAENEVGRRNEIIHNRTKTFRWGWRPSDMQHVEPQCPICLETFGNAESVRCMPCKHVYHMECIDMWLATKNTCPSCVQDIRTGEDVRGAGSSQTID